MKEYLIKGPPVAEDKINHLNKPIFEVVKAL
jgi:hypothetical protein